MVDDRITPILKYNQEEDAAGWSLGACQCGHEYIYRSEPRPTDESGPLSLLPPLPEYEICPICSQEVTLPTSDTVVLWAENTQLAPVDKQVIKRIMALREAVITIVHCEAYCIVCDGKVSYIRMTDPIVLRYISDLPAYKLHKLRRWIRSRYATGFGDWISAFEFAKLAHRYAANVMDSLNYWRELELVLETI